MNRFLLYDCFWRKLKRNWQKKDRARLAVRNLILFNATQDIAINDAIICLIRVGPRHHSFFPSLHVRLTTFCERHFLIRCLRFIYDRLKILFCIDETVQRRHENINNIKTFCRPT